MIGIVWAHVVLWPTTKGGSTELLNDSYMAAYIPYKQIFKFAVICFFMISGFLLGDKITTTNSVQYFKNRFNTTIKPYLIAFCVFFGLLLVRAFLLKRNVTDTNSISSILKFCIYNTFFWYLPNYFICLAIILAFKKHLKSWYLGLTLLCITLLYTILTVYTNNFSAGHTTALFAYVFYLWLGAFIRHKNLVNNILKCNLYPILAVVICLFALSSLESYLLYKLHLQYFSILRIFNQLYSVAMFVLLVKLGSKKLNFGLFSPRKESYGIYLYHGFFVYFVFPKGIILINDYFGIQLWSANTWLRLLLITIYAILSYLLTVLVTKLLIRYKLAYL